LKILWGSPENFSGIYGEIFLRIGNHLEMTQDSLGANKGDDTGSSWK